MCRELIKEYKAWLIELLEILELVCEGVVPAGHLDGNIYWRTKSLWEDSKALTSQGEAGMLIPALLRYEKDGRALLAAVKAEVDALKSKNVTTNQEGNFVQAGVGSALETFAGLTENTAIPEEFRISLRREYRNQILNSLQMLVNFSFLAEEFLQGENSAKDLFETDTRDDIKWVRSGVEVGKKSESNVNRRESAYGKPYIWKGYVAG